MERIDPTNIVSINERVRPWAEPQERLQPVRIDRVVSDDDPIDTHGLQPLFGSRPRANALVDFNDISRINVHHGVSVVS